MGSYFARAIFAIAGSAAALLCAGSADAYELKHSRQGARVHWEAARIAFRIHASLDEQPEAPKAVAAALSAWSGRVGAPDLVVTRDDAPEQPGLDGKNGVFFMRDGYAPAGRALAVTVLTYDSKSGAIMDADIIVNGAYQFAVLPLTARPGSSPTALKNDADGHEPPATNLADRYDLLHVLAHESGHALGLDDEDSLRESLMYRFSAPNDPSVREPAADDIQGLSEVYGTELAASGAACEGRVSPRGPTARDGRWGVALGAGALVFVALGRRRRARVGVAAAVFGVMVWAPSSTPAARAASASRIGDATARVLGTETKNVNGLFTTEIEVEVTECHASTCPARARFVQWGGQIGDVRQDVGGYHVPRAHDDVILTFDHARIKALSPRAR